MLERQVGDREGKPDIDKVLPLFTETGLSELRQKLKGPVKVTHNITSITEMRRALPYDSSSPNGSIAFETVPAFMVVVNKLPTSEELAKMPNNYGGVALKYVPFGK